jgi:alanyl-tRNA synthetase
MSDIAPTKRLYFDDSYLREFEARVVALTTFHDRPAVVLDATALYPEGGGQPADMGTLSGVAVLDVQEEDDIIYHILAGPLPASVGDVVTGEVEWLRRYDFMQQHTGQHTISGAFYHLLGAPTTSWRLGGEVVTIDLGKAGLSEESVAEAEHLANEILWQDVAVTAKIYSRDEMAHLDMRKGSDRDGGIRVVSIGDFDRIGCGGTHVVSTGQVGAIGVRRWETRGQTTRVEFVCGARALADYHAKTATVNAAGVALSAKPDEIMPQIARLLGQSEEQRKTIADLRKQLVEYEARDLLANAGDTVAGLPLICVRRDDRDMNELRLLAQLIVEGGGVALVAGRSGASGAQAGKAQLAFACPKDAPLDLNQILKGVLPLIDGKGGGQKFQAQGGGTNIAALDAALEQARKTLLG